MYQQRSRDIDKYLSYITQQDEKYRNAMYNSINEKTTRSKEKPCKRVSNVSEHNGVLSLKIKEYKNHIKPAPVIIKNGANIEDVLMIEKSW